MGGNMTRMRTILRVSSFAKDGFSLSLADRLSGINQTNPCRRGQLVLEHGVSGDTNQIGTHRIARGQALSRRGLAERPTNVSDMAAHFSCPRAKSLRRQGSIRLRLALAFGQKMGRNTMRFAVFVLAASFAATSVLAQPLPAPASFPPITGTKGVVTTHGLSMEMADRIAHGAIEECRKMGFRTTITVLDVSGALKAFLRDDGTGPHTISLSRDKAYTAITLANRFATSGTFATARNSTLGSPMTNIQGVVGVAGGVPIKYRGEVIGGIGSSGAVGGANDERCSQAGIDAVADQLK
jgi:uncharacterized protein GlcG (DUF336 family)